MKKDKHVETILIYFVSHKCQCNEVSTTPEPQETCIDNKNCQSNEDCPGGWCFSTGLGQSFCKCNDPIVPNMDCVQWAFCKDDIECGPTGACPTDFWGGAASSK